MSDEKDGKLLKTQIVKNPNLKLPKDDKNQLSFENDVGNQKVTVFDSSAATEPFMDTNELGELRKRQEIAQRAGKR